MLKHTCEHIHIVVLLRVQEMLWPWRRCSGFGRSRRLRIRTEVPWPTCVPEHGLDAMVRACVCVCVRNRMWA